MIRSSPVLVVIMVLLGVVSTEEMILTQMINRALISPIGKALRDSELLHNKKELSVVEALQQDEVAASERAELQKSEGWATNKIFVLFKLKAT